jgi:hypothetical protein
MRTARLAAFVFGSLAGLVCAGLVMIRMGLNMAAGTHDDTLFPVLVIGLGAAAYNIARTIRLSRES